VVSLIFRESLGTDEVVSEDAAAWYFQSVPRSMFTIFRCSFGDCSTKGGTPIFEHVSESHGSFWSFTYSLFMFIVVIGLFNVISAIFVENTMAFAIRISAKKKQTELDNQARWAVNVVVLLEELLTEADPGLPGLPELRATGRCTDELHQQIVGMVFHRNLLDRVLQRESVRKALSTLDIEAMDHKYLPDILDPHSRGAIGILEFVDGIKRLRGEPRRSDIITVDLMVRTLQGKVDDILRCLKLQTAFGSNAGAASSMTRKNGRADERYHHQ